MLPRHLLAPVLLFAWQVAPVGIVKDESGGLRLALGGALGDYEERSPNCAGEILEEQRVSYRTVGGSAEYRVPKSLVRVEAHVGSISAGEEAGAVSGFAARGWHASGLLNYEERGVGLGFGLASLPVGTPIEAAQTDRELQPAVYLRISRAERVHSRVDVNTPELPGMAPDRTRLSVGQGWGAVDRFSWRLSYSETHFPPTSDERRYGAAMAVPIGRGLMFGGSFSGYDRGTAGGVFVRYRPGAGGQTRD